MSRKKKKKKNDHRFEMVVEADVVDDKVIEITEAQPVFNVADTIVLLHIGEIWNYRPKELFACRVSGYDDVPPNCLIKNVTIGWAGPGMYAVAPVWDWIKTFRPHLNIPRENMYARLLTDGRSPDSSQAH